MGRRERALPELRLQVSDAGLGLLDVEETEGPGLVVGDLGEETLGPLEDFELPRQFRLDHVVLLSSSWLVVHFYF